MFYCESVVFYTLTTFTSISKIIMSSIMDILNMSAPKLSNRKGSITKQDLVNDLVKLKQKESSNFERDFAKFSESFEERLNKKFSLLLSELSGVTEKQKTLEGKVVDLQNELNISKVKENQINNKFFYELEQRFLRGKNIIISGVAEESNGTIGVRKACERYRENISHLRSNRSRERIF